jgi:hypothetical protein
MPHAPIGARGPQASAGLPRSMTGQWSQGDDGSMDYKVDLVEAKSRPTVVVAAATTWPDLPALWGRLLGEVWECSHTGGIDRGCRNIIPFGDVGAAHEAVLGWCAAHGYRPGGIRWEIYGPHDEDPAERWTEVYWLLS